MLELRDRAEDLAGSRRQAVAPAAWSLGSGQEKRFGHFLATATAGLPPHQRIALTTPPEPAASAFFLTRWAVYHLPGHDIIPALPARASDDLDTWIAYRIELPPRDDLELVRRVPQGAIYRVIHRPGTGLATETRGKAP